jgi:sugar phosphate isomerase/epimerase
VTDLPLISAQMFSFQKLDEYADIPAIFAKLKDLGYEAVEPVRRTGTPAPVLDFFRSMAGDNYVAAEPSAGQLRTWLDDAGLKVAGCHVWLPFDKDADRILDEQEELGNDLLVSPAVWKLDGTGLVDFGDLDEITAAAERMNLAAEKARARGMRIGYHNHWEEFSHQFGERTAYDMFFDLLDDDIFAEVDIYWASASGDVPGLVERYGDRVQLLHVKDGSGQAGDRNTAVGAGRLAIAETLAAASHARAYIVEFDQVDEIWPALTDSYSFLDNQRRG